MAIDSKAKRASIVGINYVGGPGVVPEVGKPQAWRQAVGYGYYGILAGASSLSVTWTFSAEHRAAPAGVDSALTYTAVGEREHLDPGTARQRRHPGKKRRM